MLKVKVNGKKEYAVEITAEGLSGSINGKDFAWDIVKVKDGSYHAIMNNCSYQLEVVSADSSAKTLKIKVNGNKYSLELKDKYDELLQKLGIDTSAGLKIKELKSPMPGLILDVRVAEGAEVKKGDTLLVLEAMKMENILRSPGDAMVKKIIVKKGMAVEKNQVLIQFA